MPHIDTPELRRIAKEHGKNHAAAMGEALRALFEYYDHDLSESGLDHPTGSPMQAAREIYGAYLIRESER